MKKNKKRIFVSIIVLLILTIVGCKSQNIEGSLEDIMSKVYQEIPEEDRPMALTNTKVDESNIEYYLGTKEIEYKEALASESMTGSIAHSVVLIRTKENADIDAIKEKIKESVDPRKWICVGVEREEVIVKSRGDLIILIIAQYDRDKLEKGFDNL